MEKVCVCVCVVGGRCDVYWSITGNMNKNMCTEVWID